MKPVETRVMGEDLNQNYQLVRDATVQLTEGLTAEDMVIQSMPDASPLKWHLAHTTWFFEEFLLSKFIDAFQPFNPDFKFLFNSYYETVGQRHARPQRGMLSRPSLEEVLQFRQTVDASMHALLDNKQGRIAELTEVGLHHEMQHQELSITDTLHALSQNPTYPTIEKKLLKQTSVESSAEPMEWQQIDGGIFHIGFQGNAFHYDCEAPQHDYILNAFALGKRLVTNREWIEFMTDGGYQQPLLWLSDGWLTCQREQWQTPLYWQERDGQYWQYSWHGLQPLDLNAPVCHISFYEADAFARWTGHRLPTEQEWESAARDLPIQGNFMESMRWQPDASTAQNGLQQMYGDCWEWTQSPYSPYPGFKPVQGALGEYNGKFMANQFVLRGGSCATPKQQIRSTYRNFFYPHQRWQFSGLRLAKDI